MTLTLTIPDAIAESLDLASPLQDQHALELLALEGYRQEKLSRGQVGEMLGMGFQETEEFLHQNGAYLHYTIEELEEGSRNLREFQAR